MAAGKDNPGFGAELNSIYCSSATSCEAVGFSGASTVPYPLALAEVWNGRTWAEQSTGTTVGSVSLVSVVVGVSKPRPPWIERVD